MFANSIFHQNPLAKLHLVKPLSNQTCRRLNLFIDVLDDIYNIHHGTWVTSYYFFQGILPEILEELLTARKRAKADLKVFICFPCVVVYNISMF